MGCCKEKEEKTKARQKAIVKGWYGHNNLGDESYKITFPKIFKDQFDLSFSDAESIKGDHDVLFVGGGDIFDPSFLSEVIGHSKPCFAASVTIPDSPCEQMLKQMDWVAVRDKRSYEAIQGLCKSFYCPDFGFALDANPYRGKEIISRLFAEEGRDLYQNKIAVVINAHLLSKPGDATKKHIAFENLCFQLAEVCDNTNASFLFLPFSTQMPWDDRISCGMVASRCKFWKKNIVAYDRLSVQDALDVLGAVDISISTRLHSTIFSFVGCTPIIDITHNHKNSRLLEDMNMSDLSVNYWKLCGDSIKKKIDDILYRKDFLREEIYEGKLEEQRELIERFKNDVRCL